MSVTVCGAASGKCDLYSIKQYKYKYNEGHLKYKVRHQAISGSKNNLFFLLIVYSCCNEIISHLCLWFWKSLIKASRRPYKLFFVFKSTVN